MYKLTNLELSPQQLQSLRQEYWGVNLLIPLREFPLMLISDGLSLIAGISAAFFAWFHPGRFSKAFASLACGFGAYQLVGRFLERVPFDVVTPYGLTPDNWVWIVNGGAIAAGLGTAIATGLLIWQRYDRSTKILISLSSTAGFFGLYWLSFSSSFVSLGALAGLAVTPSSNENWFIWISAAISAVFAIVSAFLLWLHTHRSIKTLLCLSSGLGATALSANFFLLTLLGLGYVD